MKKKLLVMLLSLTMVVGFSTNAFAENDGTDGSKVEKPEVEISEDEDEDKVDEGKTEEEIGESEETVDEVAELKKKSEEIMKALEQALEKGSEKGVETEVETEANTYDITFDETLDGVDACYVSYHTNNPSNKVEGTLTNGTNVISGLSGRTVTMIFVKPTTGRLITGMTADGAGQIYSTQFTNKFPNSKEIIDGKAAEGYVAYYGYTREGSATIHDSVVAAKPTLNVEAIATPDHCAKEGDTITIDVTVTPQKTLSSGKAELEEARVDELLLNGVAQNVEFEKDADGNFTATLSYVATSEDEFNGTANLSISATVEYCLKLSAGTADQIITSKASVSTSSDATVSFGHDWDEGTVTKEATCTETGNRHYVCQIDDSHTYDEEIPATGHTLVTDKGYAATCEETGLTDGSHCAVCNEVLEAQTVIPATGHDWMEVLMMRAAPKAPSCTETGNRHFVCRNNSSHTKDEEVPATGHAWDEGVVTKPATYTEDGVITYTCEHDASHTYTEVIPKLVTPYVPPQDETPNPPVDDIVDEPVVDENEPTIDIDDERDPLGDAPDIEDEISEEDEKSEDTQFEEEKVPLSDVPKTGDEMQLALYVVLLGMAGMGLAVTARKKKENK